MKQYTVFTRINAAALIKLIAPKVRRLFEGGAYSKAALIRGLRLFKDYKTILLFLYFYSTVHFLSVNFPMEWYLTDNKSRITREIHAVKETREFHDNKGGNISGESIGGAALIRGRR